MRALTYYCFPIYILFVPSNPPKRISFICSLSSPCVYKTINVTFSCPCALFRFCVLVHSFTLTLIDNRIYHYIYILLTFLYLQIQLCSYTIRLSGKGSHRIFEYEINCLLWSHCVVVKSRIPKIWRNKVDLPCRV